MAQAVIKLFRDPAKAEKATRELQSRGYSHQEISVLLTDKARAQRFLGGNGSATAEVDIPGVGPTTALGPIADLLTQAEGTAEAVVYALRQGLDISQELYPYYEFGLSLGGVIVGVQAEEGKAAEVRQVLREADAEGDKGRPALWSQSPGFSRSQRMVESNPLDTKLSGDFRRY